MTTLEEYVKKKREKAVVAVYLIMEMGNEILFALRQNTGYQDGNWNLPSGHVEDGELPIPALLREVREELDVDIFDFEPKLVHVCFRPQHDETGNRLDLFFLVPKSCRIPTNAEPHKCAKLEWFRHYELPENTTPHVRHAIECWRAGVVFSELSLDWLKERGLYKLPQ